jgi:hypothetical protein
MVRVRIGKMPACETNNPLSFLPLTICCCNLIQLLVACLIFLFDKNKSSWKGINGWTRPARGNNTRVFEPIIHYFHDSAHRKPPKEQLLYNICNHKTSVQLTNREKYIRNQLGKVDSTSIRIHGKLRRPRTALITIFILDAPPLQHGTIMNKELYRQESYTLLNLFLYSISFVLLSSALLPLSILL